MSEKTHEVLTIREIAELLKLAEKTVYSMTQRGELSMFKARGQWCMHRTDFDEWMAQPRRQADLTDWREHERQLELLDLPGENFLRYDSKGEVPSQIPSYLSSNFRELRNLGKDDAALRVKTKVRWYVPDPRRAGNLEKLRERALLREFAEYRDSEQRTLRVFRLEAVRAGSKRAWQEQDYATIIAVARKIPENVLQEDPKLLMWFDQAMTRSEREM